MSCQAVLCILGGASPGGGSRHGEGIGALVENRLVKKLSKAKSRVRHDCLTSETSP